MGVSSCANSFSNLGVISSGPHALFGLTSNMDKNYQTDMIVLDFAKAFDKVIHPRLLHKLEHYDKFI
jgi:hypothetical protein